MINLHIHTEEVGVAMGRDILDPVPTIKFDPRGIDHVTKKTPARLAELDMTYSAEPWDVFSAYFRRTWLTLYPPHLWNVHAIHPSHKQPTGAVQSGEQQ